MDIRIQKGIPIPPGKPSANRGGVSPIYPWAQMEIGDSFLCPGRYAHQLARQASKDERKFAARQVQDGYRIWRVA